MVSKIFSEAIRRIARAHLAKNMMKERESWRHEIIIEHIRQAIPDKDIIK